MFSCYGNGTCSRRHDLQYINTPPAKALTNSNTDTNFHNNPYTNPISNHNNANTNKHAHNHTNSNAYSNTDTNRICTIQPSTNRNSVKYPIQLDQRNIQRKNNTPRGNKRHRSLDPHTSSQHIQQGTEP